MAFKLDPLIEDELRHYGVKGMKWGVQKDEAVLRRLTGTRIRAAGGTREEREQLNKEARRSWKDYKKSTTFRERRQDRKLAIQEKFSYLLEEAIKDPTATMITRDTMGTMHYLSGKTFVDHVSRGGLVNVPYTDIFD